jgi:hypothetical protein
VSLEPDFIDMALQTYIEIMEHFRNSALLKVSSWVIGEFTHRICTPAFIQSSGTGSRM